MSEKVIIGCKLPSGATLEIGYDVTAKDQNGTRTMLQRLDNYARVKLNGWNTGRPPGSLALLNPQHGQTSVDKTFWERWKKEHKDATRWLRSGLLIEAKDQAEFDAKCIDRTKILSGLEPQDPNKLPEGVKMVPKIDDEEAAA